MQSAVVFDADAYFQVAAFVNQVSVDQWGSYDGRLAENTDRVLDIPARDNCLAMFLILGWIAENQRQVVARIAACGHEIAWHSHHDRRSSIATAPSQFIESISSMPVFMIPWTVLRRSPSVAARRMQLRPQKERTVKTEHVDRIPRKKAASEARV